MPSLPALNVLENLLHDLNELGVELGHGGQIYLRLAEISVGQLF